MPSTWGKHWLWLAGVVMLAGCYTGRRASRGINEAWRGKSRAAIEARWGKPAAVKSEGGTTLLRWSFTRRHVSLPSGSASLTVDSHGFDAYAELRPGRTWTTTTDVFAAIGADGRILEVRGPSLRWGPPRGANLRWGLLFGMHAGFGRLDDTSTPLPSGGLYIGGMLSKQLGLVGSYSLIAGSDDAGGAIGMVWSLGAQYWFDARLSGRVGPAAVLAFDPGFEDPGFAPGVNGALSYALVRRRVFVLDLRVDVTTAPGVTLGSAGIGVNVN